MGKSFECIAVYFNIVDENVDKKIHHEPDFEIRFLLFYNFLYDS